MRHDGEPALVLNLVMKDGWNGLTLGKALDAEEGKLNASLPVGVKLTKVINQAAVIDDAIEEFMVKFVVALVIVLGVSLLTLGWRVGIVVAAAVPLTLAIVLVIMLITGRVLDRITLGALIISLGLLVDDAIIAIEIMVVKLEEGFDPPRGRLLCLEPHGRHPCWPARWSQSPAFFQSASHDRPPASTRATSFGSSAFALITSWIVAVVFTPYLGVRLLPEIKRIEGGAYEHIYATPRYNRFRRVVGWSVDHKFLVVGSVVVLFLASGFGMGFVKQQFFPDSDRTEVLVEVQMPEGTSIDATSQVAAKVEGWLKGQPEAKVVTILHWRWRAAFLPGLQSGVAPTRPSRRSSSRRRATRSAINWSSTCGSGSPTVWLRKPGSGSASSCLGLTPTSRSCSG